MTAARKQAFNRNAAIASIQINWKRMCQDLAFDDSREERLSWISKFLGLGYLASLTDLDDRQLGAVAGEMKRLTGQSSQTTQSTQTRVSTSPMPSTSNVVEGSFGKERSEDGDHKTVFLASPEQIYTLDKLQQYLKWSPSDVFDFIKKRVLKGAARLSGSVPNFHMLTFRQATVATNALLHVAGHRDLKLRNGGKPVSRKDLNKYIPVLKRELQIDQRD